MPFYFLVYTNCMYFLTTHDHKRYHASRGCSFISTYTSGLLTVIKGVCTLTPYWDGSAEIAHRLFRSLFKVPVSLVGFTTVEFNTALHFSSSILSFSISASFSSSSASNSSIRLSLWFNSSILFLRENCRSRSVPISSSFQEESKNLNRHWLPTFLFLIQNW